jgi:indolepyruvate ferredoxin oxidoreductase
MLAPDRSTVIVNTHEEMPPSFIRDRDFQFPGALLLHELRSRCRADRLYTIEATRLASALLGDSIGANVFMLGFAFQRGLLPVTGASLYRALELYGVNVTENKLAFDWGRFAAENRGEVEDLASGALDESVPRSRSLAETVARRAAFLEEYQDKAYADRYRERVAQITALETRIAPGSQRLAEAVARNYFKLLAYKDEYEVARLYTRTDFLAMLRRNFGSDFKLRFHLSPPVIARRDPNSGRPRKYELGGWVLALLRVLAPLKRLRGTPWDPFGWTAERRMERRLIAEYEQMLDQLLAELDPRRLDIAVAITALPDGVRGFGPIKTASVAAYDAELARLLEDWRAAAATPAVTRSARASAA